MSFGLRDEDWVDPEPEVWVRCSDCPEWVKCPRCGECGWCLADGEFTSFDHGCWQEKRPA